MKTPKSLHDAMRAHHLKRARESTDPERRRYHLLLAASIAGVTPAPGYFVVPDWRDARARWCARMRAWARAGAPERWRSDGGRI